jgi:hypothetical protein
VALTRAGWWPDWRIALVAVIAVLAATMLLLPGHLRDQAWTLMGISPLNPPFSDARAVAASWECTRKGVDVLVRNPCDPFGRLMQYPKIWMVPAVLGWGQELTNWIGAASAVLALATVILVMGPVRRIWEAAVYLVLLLSPPVLLLLERGNVDGLILAMVGIAMVLWSSQRALIRAIALPLIELAAMLKLFPIVTTWALLRRGGRETAAAVVALGAVFGVYLLATWKEIAQVGALTQQGTFPAYGVGILVIAIRHPGVHEGPLLVHVGQGRGDAALRVVLILVVIGIAMLLSRVVYRPTRETGDGHARPWLLDAYLAGSLIYTSSFLLFNNWDYRMSFVLLAVPQLLTWSRAAQTGLAWLARATILMFVAAALGSRFSPDAAYAYGFGQAAKTALCILLLAFILVELQARLQRWSPVLLTRSGRGTVDSRPGVT